MVVEIESLVEYDQQLVYSIKKFDNFVMIEDDFDFCFFDVQKFL